MRHGRDLGWTEALGEGVGGSPAWLARVLWPVGCLPTPVLQSSKPSWLGPGSGPLLRQKHPYPEMPLPVCSPWTATSPGTQPAFDPTRALQGFLATCTQGVGGRSCALISPHPPFPPLTPSLTASRGGLISYSKSLSYQGLGLHGPHLLLLLPLPPSPEPSKGQGSVRSDRNSRTGGNVVHGSGEANLERTWTLPQTPAPRGPAAPPPTSAEGPA